MLVVWNELYEYKEITACCSATRATACRGCAELWPQAYCSKKQAEKVARPAFSLHCNSVPVRLSIQVVIMAGRLVDHIAYPSLRSPGGACAWLLHPGR